MGGLYRSGEHNPDGARRFGARADARPGLSFTAYSIAEGAESMVPLVGDASLVLSDLIQAAAGIAKFAEAGFRYRPSKAAVVAELRKPAEIRLPLRDPAAENRWVQTFPEGIWG